MKLPIVLAALILSVTIQESVGEFAGKVVGVKDGDTIEVLVNQKPVTVRLEGIDAPERGQDYGTKSKQALSDLVFGKLVVVKSTGLDRYGRTLGFVYINGVNANAKMLADGWAWHFKKYNDDPELARLEREARAAKRGLWQDPNPIAPWELRSRQSKPAPDEGVAVSYWLNTSSNVRHNPSCKYYKNTKQGRICRPDEGKPCGICGG